MELTIDVLEILMPHTVYKSDRGPFRSRVEKGFKRAAEHSQENYMGRGIWLITGETHKRIYAVDVEWLSCSVYLPAYEVEPCRDGFCHHIATALKLEAERRRLEREGAEKPAPVPLEKYIRARNIKTLREPILAGGAFDAETDKLWGGL